MSHTAVSAATQAFLDRPHGHLIDFESVRPPSNALLDVFDPSTGRVIAQIPDGGPAEVEAAVASSRRAFEAWRRTRPAERERILIKLSELIERHAEELAELETLNQGKSINLSRAVDVGSSVEFVRYAAGWATKIEGTTVDISTLAMPGARYRASTLREPVGVVAAVVPWNFPLAIALWKVVPALACGCTVVLKPSEETPLTALRVVELCREAGVPPGVINVLLGRGATAGAALVSHRGVDKIAFTGSTEVGKIIGQAAVQNMTRFSLELGGKSPVIVMPDADVEMAAQGAAAAIFLNNGQVCTAGSRLLVHRSTFEQVTRRLAEIAGGMAIGPGLDPTAQINPLVSARQQARVQGYVQKGLVEGARALSGGAPHDGPGYFVRPTVLVDVTPDSTVVREEIFGPVVAALPFDTVEEALHLANDTAFGLAASVWSNDYRAVMALTGGLKAGTVWVNTHNVLDPALPFGGFKQSGIGREHGRAMVELYTESKSVMMAY